MDDEKAPTVKVSMPRLANAALPWDGDAFARALKQEIESLPPATLPLSSGLTQGGQIDDIRRTAMVLQAQDEGEFAVGRVGVFFTEVVGGCSCGDEPMDVNAWCELLVSFDKRTAVAHILPLAT